MAASGGSRCCTVFVKTMLECVLQNRRWKCARFLHGEHGALHGFYGLLGLCGKVLVVGEDYRGGFCVKVPETSLVFDKACASQLQEEPTAGQG